MAGSYLCQAGSLIEYVRAVFRAIGTEDDIATVVARHLVTANLSGHDSHGVQRVWQYVAFAAEGHMVPSARPRILRETTVAALIDAGRGFGHYSTRWAMDWAIERARAHGVAVAAVRHSTHIGRLGEYAEQAAEAGVIGIVTMGIAGLNTQSVVPFGGAQPFFGTNPWAFGIPAAGRSPVVFDGATSVVAEGKIRVAQAKGVPMPEGAIVDRDGAPTTDPAAFFAGGALLPIGGALAGHKGYGLAMASALIAGLAMIDDEAPTIPSASVRDSDKDATGQIAGVFVIAIDPGAFGDAAHYTAMTAATADAVTQVHPAAGVTEVLAPGEPEVRSRAARLRDGIPIPAPTWEQLIAVGARLGVPAPERE